MSRPRSTAGGESVNGAATAQPAALRCRGLGKRYGRVPALTDLSLDVAPGEILALLGPSGCGKTTTLRLIAGLERPDSGWVEIEGRQVASPERFLPPEDRRVGMVFQHYALFPHLSVAENVAFGLPRRDSAEARERRVAEMLALVGLGALGGRMPHELSGGQQQRVALARALAPEPALLLLDEPFSNLDARMRTTVREEVREILKRSGSTAIFVTHDQAEALFIGDRIALLNGGHLEQVDTPERIYHRPRTRFVAEFMGHTGFLPARLRGGELETEIGIVPQSLALPEGSEVELLLRPDDLALRPDPAGEARVHRRIFQGMHHLYRVRLASGRLIDCLAPHTFRLESGDPVRLDLVAGHGLECFVDGRSVTAEVEVREMEPRPDAQRTARTGLAGAPGAR